MDIKTHDQFVAVEHGSDEAKAVVLGQPSRGQRIRTEAWRWVVEGTLTLVAVGTGVLLGWFAFSNNGPRFIDESVSDLDVVLERMDAVGVRCSEALDTGGTNDGTMSTCRGDRRFSLHVANSIDRAYESFDLASHLGCYTVGNLPHTRFYVARSQTWNLLTHDKQVAENLLRLPGVTVTTGRCAVPNTGRPE